MLVNQSLSSQSSCEEESVYQPLFFDDISSILRGHGDGPEPIKETVILVEKILLQQLRAIVNLLLEIAYERKKTYQPSLKDVEYLMRLHPQRIYRLKKHLSELQYIMKIQDLRAGRIRNEMNIMDVSEDEDPQPIVEKYDEEKTRRIFRVDRITQFLNESQYSAYVEARRTSFYHSPAMKMKLQKWLSNQDIKLTPALLTILVYLSHETIAILVDHCILSRLSSSNRSVDPFNRTTSNGQQ